MMLKKLLFFLILYLLNIGLFTVQAQQQAKQYLYKDKIVAMEKWYGDDKKIDSIKTYHKTGELDELFYFNAGKLNGKSYKFKNKGEKVTTWEFKRGKLKNRIDHIIEFNKKDKEKIERLHAQLKVLNDTLKKNSRSTNNFARRAYIRYMLNNKTLALQDHNRLAHRVIGLRKMNKGRNHGKLLGNIYDVKGAIYSSYEMENYATHYRFKATEADPENARLQFNLGAYLFKIKSYRLSKIYLNKALETWPKHAFTHRVLAAMYTDFSDYKKAKHHIDIAYPKEKHLLKHGSGKVERDIRTLRGFISHKLGNSKEGIADLEEAINLNEDNSFAYRNLGVIHNNLGNHSLACEYLQKAKTLGYEKIHDRKDLQNYLDSSCNINNETAKTEAKKDIKKIINPLNRPYVFPNPATDVVSLKNITFDNYEYTLYNFESKLIRESSSSNNTINLSELSTGLYLLKVVNKGVEYNFKVAKK